MADQEGVSIQDADTGPKRKPHVRRIPRSENQQRAAEIRGQQIKTTGKPLPSCPMTPEELMDAWSIGQNDAMGVTVKILRQKVGTEALELVDSIPLVEFDARRLAANFGHGRYLLRPAAGTYAKCSAVLPISDELARACGWGKLPATAQDMTAERVVRAAVEGPTDPLDLMAAMERLMDRKLAERAVAAPGAAAAFNPMEAMNAQMAQMTAWMGFMDRMEAQMQARVERRMGVDPEPAPSSHMTFLESLLPLGLKILDRMTSGPAMTPQRSATTPQRPTLPPLADPPLADPQAADHPAQVAATGGSAMPELTNEERQAVALSAKMLSPFAPQLVELGNSPATEEQIVGELEGYVPDHMVGPLTTLAAIITKHGPGVLGIIHPGLAVPKWGVVLQKLAVALQ